ncbi:YgeY family selenium metabolism-linked hydrolase [Candidatus Zixiibacteriota bacterium]
MSDRETITGAAEAHREDIISFLREIIAIPSYSGKEQAVVERLEQEMWKVGFDEVRVDAMGNLIGRMGSGDRVVAIDGHCDTVGIGNLDIWERDPFGAELKDGVIYGRGAADQKGGLAAAIYAARIARETGIPDGITLYVVASVIEEDVEGINWQNLINKEGVSPEVVLLTEPTDLKICIGQRGRMEIRVRTTGISCHGSAPDRGMNAIYSMAPIIGEVEGLHRKMASDSILGPGSLAITDIRSTAPSLCAVADSATIHIDRRLTEGETRKAALAEIEALPAVRKSGAEVFIPEYEVTAWTGQVLPVTAYYPPWLMSRDDPLVRQALDIGQEQFGREPEVSTWQFSTNGVATRGMFDIPTFGFGPGAEEHAHMPTDQVRVDDLVTAMGFYTAFILRF